jgi:hypothetical protein
VVVQQAIQLGVSSGDAVYAILRLVPWKEEVKTPLATWGDMGAIWSSSTSAPLPATPGALSLVHIYNGSQTPLPVLRVEMWRKRVVGLGDECLGYSEISAAPLLLYTGAPAERWLQLRSDLDALQVRLITLPNEKQLLLICLIIPPILRLDRTEARPWF